MSAAYKAINHINHYVAYTFKKYCLFVTFPLKALIFPDQIDIKELCYVDVFLRRSTWALIEGVGLGQENLFLFISTSFPSP